MNLLDYLRGIVCKKREDIIVVTDWFRIHRFTDNPILIPLYLLSSPTN